MSDKNDGDNVVGDMAGKGNGNIDYDVDSDNETGDNDYTDPENTAHGSFD